VRQRSTRGDVALGNLDARIQAIEQRSKAAPLDLGVRAQLVDLLLTRTQFTSSFDDFARVHELTEKAPAEFPTDPRSFLLRARAEGAVHRFDAALDDLARAEALGDETTAHARSTIQIARGQNLEAVLQAARALGTSRPTFESLSQLAAAEAALGHFEAADDRYEAALGVYRDVSPFPIAYVAFQRGVMWAELANAPERALPLYREAVERLPGYVVANVHLAELEATHGQAARARERLRSLLEDTRDPEPMGLYGSLLLAEDASHVQGREWVERARAGYNTLLGLERAAFLDHAAEFFSGVGAEPQRAVELASENLAMRQTGRAYSLVIRAALAAGNEALGCTLLERARPAASANLNLRALLEREAGRCGTR
jgi:tetratricopeptide (TPR) repeat protein